MGTTISLEIAGVTLDAAKNHMGTDHGHLFQTGDLARRFSDQVDYTYYEDNPDEVPDDSEEAFCRSLSRVLPRLGLLGSSLEEARMEYDALVEEERSFRHDSGEGKIDFLTFDQFCDFACRRPLTELMHDTNFDATQETFRDRFPDDPVLIARLPNPERDDLFWSEASYFGATTCILSAYSMMQVFAKLEANLDAEVVWQFGPIVTSGWVERIAFTAGPSRRETTLIATEGSSDAHILKHALELRRLDVADFFSFIDVNESHPFSGTGSLRKFAEGLVRIDIQNRVIILFDNDAEGVDAYRKLQTIRMPSNMTTALLPDHESLKSVPARGPEGTVLSDINGRAAAIECYLDLNLPDRPPATVLWSNYKVDVDAWHGALEYKTSYAGRFLALTSETATGYDFRRIDAVLDHLVTVAIDLARADNI